MKVDAAKEGDRRTSQIKQGKLRNVKGKKEDN